MTRNATIIVVTVVLVAVVATGVVVALATGNDSPEGAAATTTVAPDGTTTTTLDPGDPTSATTSSSEGTASYTPVFEDADCELTLLSDRSVRCGFLIVPEDRSLPDGDEVRIHVAIFESDDPDAPDDPLVYLDGGPGGETLETLQFSLETTWAGFLENRDVIFFDQRGTGLSTPSLACTETRDLAFDVLDEPFEAETYVVRELDALTECRNRLDADGVDFTAYNSASNAADVADLRVALGIEEWNLLGISYGTRLATTVMRDAPEGIRSVILDSVYTPDTDLITEAPANLSRALDELFAGCEADPGCAAAYPDLENRLFALVERLEEEPLQTVVRDVFTNERYDTVVDGDFLLGAVFQGLYSAEVIPVLPQMIAELEKGDTTTITLLATNDLANGAFFSYGMHLSVQCNEEVPFAAPDEVAAAATAQPRLEAFFAGATNVGVPVFDICDLWQAGTAEPIENAPVSSDIPTLVLAGEYDPITPPAWGEQALATLDNSTFVEFPGVGHAASVAGDCPLQIALSFIDDPAATPDTDCIATMGGPDFTIPGDIVVEPVDLVSFEEEIFGVAISGVAPSGWDSIGPGAWARSTTLIDQTALIQQAAPGAADAGILIGLLSGQLGFDDDPDPVGTEERGERTWSRYLGTIDGFPADVAIGSDGDDTGIVVLVSSLDERDALVEEVLLPVLEAFSSG